VDAQQAIIDHSGVAAEHPPVYSTPPSLKENCLRTD
jgi:hypothetical protein